MFQAPAHVRRKHFSAALAPDLKKKHGTNTFPVKAGDTVRVMRGDREGFEGKVTRVERQDYRVFVEGVSRQKVDGTTIQIPLHPSKVMITSLDLDDKWRREALKKRGVPSEKALPVAEEEKKEEVKEQPEAKREKVQKPRKKRKTEKAPPKTEPAQARKPRETKPKRQRTRKTKTESGAE